MPKAIKYFNSVLLLISFFTCSVSFRVKLVIIFYLQDIWIFQLQGGSLCLLTQWWGEIGMFYICLSPSISMSKASKNSTIFKFVFLHCLLMLLFSLSSGLNAAYLNLSNIGISVINGYPSNLMYAVILYCFLEQLWTTRYRIVINGDAEVNPGPKRNPS